MPVLAIAALMPALAAQTVGGPAVSYVFDAPATAIRRLVGVAGSAFLADSVLSGMQFAAVAPNGITAIAVWQDRVEWIPDLGAYPQGALTIAGALPNEDQILWDSKSSAVALFSSADGQVRFVQFADGSPVLQNAATPDWCPGAIGVLAADPVHSNAAVTCGGGLFLLRGSAAPAAIQTPDSPVAAAFADDGSLYIAGSIAGSPASISLLKNPASDTSAQLLFNEPDLTSASAAILVQSAVQLLYSADGAQRRVRVYDLNSFGKVDDLPLDWQPTQFQPFSPTSFLLNTRSKPGDPMILLRTAPQRGMFFIPTGQ